MANAVVVFASATALAFAVVQRRVLRAGFAVVGVTAVCLVGFSRVELGAHWTSDVVASAVWTSGWLLAVFTIVGRPARHGVMPPG
jgi:membrane-associated phospholipid phosphatase